MGSETERKFLLKNDGWLSEVFKKTLLVQGYLSKDPERTVRVRIAGDEAFLTIKGKPPADNPLDTPEFEYAVPLDDARAMMRHCLPGTIEKVRHEVMFGGKKWEIDVFAGDNKGLIMAEIELTHADEPFTRPSWLGEEVTHDHRYKNAMLSEKPFTKW